GVLCWCTRAAADEVCCGLAYLRAVARDRSCRRQLVHLSTCDRISCIGPEIDVGGSGSGRCLPQHCGARPAPRCGASLPCHMRRSAKPTLSALVRWGKATIGYPALNGPDGEGGRGGRTTR